MFYVLLTATDNSTLPMIVHCMNLIIFWIQNDFFKFATYVLLLFYGVFGLCVCVCTSCAPGAWVGQERVLELDL